MLARALLRGLATDLYKQAQEYVPLVFESGPGAVPSPFGSLIQRQGASTPDSFHLPEPLLGVVDNPKVLVLGLNPGFNPGMDIPQLTDTLETYVDWYTTALKSTLRDSSGRPVLYLKGDPRPHRIWHFDTVEKVLEKTLGTQPLGQIAVYADAIPWKSKSPPSFRDPAVLQLGKERVRRILRNLMPSVVLTLGADSSSLMSTKLADPPEITEAHLGLWHGKVVPMYHPNSRKTGDWNAYLERVSLALASALNDE